MLDPLSALSLVSNIVDILEVGGQVASQTHEFLRSSSDALPSNEILTQLTKENKELADGIKSISGTEQPLTRYEAAAQDAAARYSRNGADLLLELDSLKPKQHSRRLRTGMSALGKSLTTVAKRRSLERLQKKIEASEAQLSTALLQLILHNQAVNHDDLKHWMESNNIREGSGLSHSIDELKRIVGQLQQFIQTESRLREDGSRLIQDEPQLIQDTQLIPNDSHLIEDAELLEAGSQLIPDGSHSPMSRGEFDERVEKIMASLRFADMEYRRFSISASHRQTFEWSFDKDKSPLKNWLETGHGIFWVCGLAGSGKSTFMKYLSNNTRTRQSLRAWSDNRTRESLKAWSGPRFLIFVDHYFWYAGTQLQKSHEGLLHSVLYQVFSYARKSSLRSALSILCAERLARNPDDLALPWARDELVRTIRSLCDCTEIDVCVFVDGLDEYSPQTEHSQLIAELRDFAKLPNVKLCVSSRPWTAFKDAFGQLYDQIQLEDLTRADIVRYVSDHLDGGRHLSNKEDLVRLVTTKAKGVFLWVYLVVAALKERIEAQNSPKQLLKCLEEFPDELEEYFRQSIYRRIHKTWRNDTAQALKMALLIFQNQEEVGAVDGTTWKSSYMNSFLPYWLLQEKVEEPDFAVSMSFQHVSREEVQNMMNTTVKHLNACCRDFLCISSPMDVLLESEDNVPKYDNKIHGLRIDFLHRTVFDFLRSSEMSNLLNQNIPTHFMADLFLLNVAVACVKVIIHDHSSRKIIREDGSAGAVQETFRTPSDVCRELVETIAMTLPAQAPRRAQPEYRAYITALTEVDRVGSQYVKTVCNGYCWEYATDQAREQHRQLLSRLTACDLHAYANALSGKSHSDWVGSESQYTSLIPAPLKKARPKTLIFQQPLPASTSPRWYHVPAP